MRVAFTAAPTLAVPRVLLNGWSASTATPVFAMHFMGSFRDAIRCWNPVSVAAARTQISMPAACHPPPLTFTADVMVA